MDILKRNLAPISKEAWNEIDESAKDVLTSMLSARKVLKLNGPKGWNYTAVGEGRLNVIEDGKVGELCTGTYKLKPLVEGRVSFELNKWELDNISRGAKDIDLDPLEKACEKLALFEENAIYNGYKDGDIDGLIASAGHTFELGNNGNDILKAISDGRYALFNSYIKPPYDLIVSQEVYDKINRIYDGANIYKIIKGTIGGDIIRSKVIEGGIMIPHQDEDLEFTVGVDYSIGYEKELDHTVQLFVTESIMLRVLDENKVVYFK